MTPNFTVDLPKDRSSVIKVMGVGGGGSNAVSYMAKEGIVDVDFFVCNTDSQALDNSGVKNKIQIGSELTEGRGAGQNPEVGKKAAEESLDTIIDSLGTNTKMLFITAGMGGGTGTGAAPVIAKAAKAKDILTVAIVTTPFAFEGPLKQKVAMEGIERLREGVDTLLIISNDKIKEMYSNLPIMKAFSFADEVLATAVKGIAEIITVAGYKNVDFNDVHTILKDSGVAILGNGIAEGDNRALKAAQQALTSPLLDDNMITGAKDLLINITFSDPEVTMEEYDAINSFFQEEAGQTANLKCGLCVDEKIGKAISVTVIAAGFERKQNHIVEVNNETELNEISEDHILEEALLDEDNNSNHEDEEPNRQINIFDLLEEKEKKQSNERLIRLKDVRDKVKHEHGIEELEKTPAYLRRNVKLEDTAHSSESSKSRYSLFEDKEKSDKPEIKSQNSFLHDNVD